MIILKYVGWALFYIVAFNIIPVCVYFIVNFITWGGNWNPAYYGENARAFLSMLYIVYLFVAWAIFYSDK